MWYATRRGFSVATLNSVTVDVLQLFRGHRLIVRYAICHHSRRPINFIAVVKAARHRSHLPQLGRRTGIRPHPDEQSDFLCHILSLDPRLTSLMV
jgi:hypothetical protein